MTVIRHNSISGISSINAQSDVINFYDNSGVPISIAATFQVGTGATISGETNTITASTNGSERVRITSDGDVGIGDISPNNNYGTNLSVHSTATDGARIKISDGTSGKGNLNGFDLISLDGAAYIMNRYNNAMYFYTNNTERMRISANGNVNVDSGTFFVDAVNNRVGIGTTSPAYKCDIDTTSSALRLFSTTTAAKLVITSDDAANAIIEFGDESDDDRGAITYDNPNNALIFQANAAERARIDSSGRLLVGTSSSFQNANTDTMKILVASTTSGGLGAGFYNFQNDNNWPGIALGRSRNNTVGSHTVVNSGDVLGNITFEGSDGTAFKRAAMIEGEVDGTPDSNDMPGRLVFSTTADGASSPTERMRIDSSGNVGIGTTSPGTFGALLEVNGMGLFTADGGGDLIRFKNSSSTANLTGYLSDVNQDIIQLFAYDSSYSLSFGTNNTERARIDSSGRLLVGTSSGRSIDGINGNLQLEGTTTTGSTINLIRNANGTSSAFLQFGKSRGSSNGSNTIVQNNDVLGYIQFAGADGTDIETIAANIRAEVDGTPGDNVMPGRLVFSTTAATQSSPTERMRIDSSGRLLVGTSLTSAVSTVLLQGGSGGSTGPSSLWLARGTTPADGNSLGDVIFSDNGHGAAAFLGAYRDGGTWNTSTSRPTRLEFFTTANSASIPTERMRITSLGYAKFSNSGTYINSSSAFPEFVTNAAEHALWLRNTNGTNPYGLRIDYTLNANDTTKQIIYCVTNSTLKMELRSNGGIANYSDNNSNLSDEREKKNIEPLDSTWSRLKNWELKKFHRNEDADTEDKRYGVIAQQVAPHCPEVITEWVKQKAEDAVLDEDGNVVTPAQEEIVRMGVKEQQMMWMAIKALQEAQTRIETLEAEVAALKAA